ncbi:MAG TPA: hypothetical protein VF103_04140 [Polyangiaceae bacterium]
MTKRLAVVMFAVFLSGCQSDEDLCKDVQKKMSDCGTIGPRDCPENLDDHTRDQYECIMDKECSKIHECAD